MAEAVVGFVVRKLSNIIEKEMELLGVVGKKVERLQRDLTTIKCYLKDADSKHKGDATVQNWLNDLRDVAYRIEDATDTYFLKVEDECKGDRTILQNFIQRCLNPLEVPILLHKLGTELDDIQNELERISKSRVNYGNKDLQDKSKGEAVLLPFRRATYQEIDETEVVGLQADKDNILKLMEPGKTTRRAVITIVGTGGLGKTTLAHMVYMSARADFEYHIMLSISQQFSLVNLLRKMLRQVKNSIPKNLDVGDLISELKRFLYSKRYLIILDDVWSVDLWNQLKDALPDNKKDSRVLMTSRFIDVAKSADSKMAPYELQFLNGIKGQDLLLKKALPCQEPHEKCLGKILKEVAIKCNGLPLALIVVGGILSTKERSYPAWKRVSQTLDWHSDGKDCMRVLAMSYEDMPYYLKSCFLYLASFPKNREISAKRLIRMWVAEGFLPQDEKKTMEQTAEDCLEELFQRSMVQVSSRCMNGSIKRFRVHDLLHDLAMHQAGQENFVMVLTQASYVKKFNRGIRRASLESCSPQLMEVVGPNTRSLLWFGSELPNYSNFRLIKVLELVGVTKYTNKLIHGLGELIHLKYLGFRECCKIPISSRFFRRMKNLETLDLRGTEAAPSDDLWAIDTLRHVLFDNLSAPTADQRNLQTIKWVSPPALKKKWPVLNNLCKLGVNNLYDEWGIVTNLLETLPSLISLGIKGSNLPKNIVYPEKLPNFMNLQSLYLCGSWFSETTPKLEASLFPQNLIKLTLIESRLGQNPMPELGKLESLKKLCLGKHVLNYSGHIACRKGFPVLQYLEVSDLVSLMVEEGAMPKLTYLRAPNNLDFYLPPELGHVQYNSNF